MLGGKHGYERKKTESNADTFIILLFILELFKFHKSIRINKIYRIFKEYFLASIEV